MPTKERIVAQKEPSAGEASGTKRASAGKCSQSTKKKPAGTATSSRNIPVVAIGASVGTSISPPVLSGLILLVFEDATKP